MQAAIAPKKKLAIINYPPDYGVLFMLTLLSPAKKQAIASVNHCPTPTRIQFQEETQQLVACLQHLSPEALRSLMSISESLAHLNHERFTQFASATPFPAVLLFQGDAYKTLDAATFTPEQAQYCQRHLLILSGLYGLLRPYDDIQPYRLEMKTRLTTPHGNSLYSFWGSKLAQHLNQQLATHTHRYVINLASNEYSQAIDTQTLAHPLITVQFKEPYGDDYRVIGIQAKKARGLMARYIMTEQIDTPKSIQGFQAYGYRFQPQLSSSSMYLFHRTHDQ